MSVREAFMSCRQDGLYKRVVSEWEFEDYYQDRKDLLVALKVWEKIEDYYQDRKDFIVALKVW
jgi:hypothetical protein